MAEYGGDVIVHHPECRCGGADVGGIGSGGDPLLDHHDTVAVVDLADLDGRVGLARPLPQRGMALGGAVRITDLDIVTGQRGQGAEILLA